MVSIRKAGAGEAALLADIGKTTFCQSHGHSAEQKDIDAYVQQKFNEQAMALELNDPANLFYIAYYSNKAAGYSKIVLNSPHPDITQQNMAKLERLYLLEEFLDKRMGAGLLDFNLALANANGQAGMWLYVWKENARAISFYTKAGFSIIGSFDFPISASHSNPNHLMKLLF